MLAKEANHLSFIDSDSQLVDSIAFEPLYLHSKHSIRAAHLIWLR